MTPSHMHSCRANEGLDQPFTDGKPSLLVHRWGGNAYDAGYTVTVLVARLS